MPRDGGTNLEGLLRDPRASRVTPAGLRLADPGWMPAVCAAESSAPE